MQFKPKTEEEVRRIFDKGDYRFDVSDATERNDKEGRPMLAVKINIHHSVINGKTNIVDVYFTSNPNFEFLFRHFMCSIGLEDVYEKGEVKPFQLIGKKGVARIGVKVDKTGTYPDKNSVLDFLISDKSSTESSNSNKELNEEIPW